MSKNKNSHIVLYTEHEGVDCPSTNVGRLMTDGRGRIIFEDLSQSFRFTFFDVNDTGAMAEILQRSNIKVERMGTDPELFDLSAANVEQ